MEKSTRVLDAKKLREETGHGLMDCVMALNRKDGNYDQAKAYLQSPEWRKNKLINEKLV